MKNSMKLLALVLVAAAAMFGAVQPAQAQAVGSTAVSVNVNGIVILYYYSTVNVTMPSTLLGPNAVSAGTATNTATAVTGGAEATLANPTSATAVTLGAVNLDILNAWSVRALNTANANSQVSITPNGSTLTAATGNVIAITGRQVRATSGSFGASSVFPSAGTFTTPQTGDVRLVLDMTGVTAIGNFTGGGYTLTAVNI
jgi:hypothetical protein